MKSNFEERLQEALGAFAGPAPAAPVKPAPVRPSRPAPAPTPTRPSEPSKPVPFRPTKPAVMPKPKARDRERNTEIDIMGQSIGEAYEDEVHRNTQDFWANLPRNREHPFGQHPILAMHGNALARAAYDHTSGRTGEIGGHVEPYQQYQIFMQIMQIEAQHRERLIDLAKDVTVQIWGVDREMLDPRLGEAGDNAGDQDFGDEPAEAELTQEVRDQINKRITLNTMTQGSAVHAMLSMHWLVDRALEDIDPRLLELYNKLSASSVHQYWMMDLPMTIMQLMGGVAGTERVDFDEETEEPTIVASGVCFPILCQELSKGVMELLTMHGLSDMDETTLRTVYKHADRMEDEPYLIQIGPELWRRFLEVKPKDVSLAEVVAALSVLPPQQVNEIINSVVENPDQAKEMIERLVEGE